EEVLAGRKTAAECAAEYPAIAHLESILAATVSLRTMQGHKPRPDAQQKIEARVRARVLYGAENPPARRARRMPAGLIWAGALVLMFVVLAAGAGSNAVSGRSLPGEPLYAIKRADESAKLFLSPTSARASVYAGLARKRLDELIVLNERGTLEPGVLNSLAADMVTVTDNALAATSAAPPEQQAEILNTLVLITDEQQSVLSAVKAQAPPEAQAGLDRALQAAGQSHEQALQQLEEVGAPAATGTPSPVGSPTIMTTTTVLTETLSAPSETSSPSLLGSTITATATLSTTTPIAPSPTATLVPPGQTRATPQPTPTSQTTAGPSQTQAPGSTTGPPSQTSVPPG
ncbi:MAG: DUF5667 domain-containing protein, partial [Anaerolineales bacterium]